MKAIEIIGYCILGFVAFCWFIVMMFGLIAAFPFGLIGLIGIIGLGCLFIKVLAERLESKEDDYYSNNVDQ